MAISETMSNPSEWMQFYPTNFSSTTQIQTPPTTAASSISATSMNNNNNNLSLDHGRISKPLRRRSRASRRTPTTLFNTDTTNFRAMVQQFTGGHIAPFAARSQLPSSGGATATYGFSVFGTQQIGGGAARPTTTMAPTSGFHMQYSNQLQQQNMFMTSSNMQGGSGSGGGGGGVSSHAPLGSSSTNDNRGYSNYMV